MRLGGVEAGGTKWICAVGDGRRADIVETFPTTTPAETIAIASAFFERHPVDAVGIACFGPLDLQRDSPTYGYITSTPKEGWVNTEVAGAFHRALRVPIGIDTDVNGALLAEHRWGAGQNLPDLAYVTVGTGIGGAVMANGQLVHGLLHTEVGHIPVRRAEGDTFAGVCPYHGDCLEGLASGHSIATRWGVSGQELPADHIAWEWEAYYLSQMIQTLICVASPRRIILGGSVSFKEGLLGRIHSGLPALLNGYFQISQLTDRIDSYIAHPSLIENGQQSCGYIGAMLLGEAALMGKG